MRRILATVVLALAALVVLPPGAGAGGPTSVIVTQPGVSAGALYFQDEAYETLAALLPEDDTRGKSFPPGGAVEYNLTWLIHDVEPWRWDRVAVLGDGSAWVSTSLTESGTAGWQPLGRAAEEVVAIIDGVLETGTAPTVVTAAPEPAAASPTPAAADEPSWFSLSGWRWALPGVLLGLVVGVVAARRPRDAEPRQVLISSEA
jgi:hypothetical protein